MFFPEPQMVLITGPLKTVLCQLLFAAHLPPPLFWGRGVLEASIHTARFLGRMWGFMDGRWISIFAYFTTNRIAWIYLKVLRFKNQNRTVKASMCFHLFKSYKIKFYSQKQSNVLLQEKCLPYLSWLCLFSTVSWQVADLPAHTLGFSVFLQTGLQTQENIQSDI